jgi:hypothetical protein
MQMSAVPYIACILGADSKTHALAPNPFNSALGPRAFDPVVNAYDNDVCNQSMSFVFSSTFAVVQILVAIHSSSSSNEIVSVGSNLHKKKSWREKSVCGILFFAATKKICRNNTNWRERVSLAKTRKSSSACSWCWQQAERYISLRRFVAPCSVSDDSLFLGGGLT